MNPLKTFLGTGALLAAVALTGCSGDATTSASTSTSTVAETTIVAETTSTTMSTEAVDTTATLTAGDATGTAAISGALPSGDSLPNVKLPLALGPWKGKAVGDSVQYEAAGKGVMITPNAAISGYDVYGNLTSQLQETKPVGQFGTCGYQGGNKDLAKCIFKRADGGAYTLSTSARTTLEDLQMFAQIAAAQIK